MDLSPPPTARRPGPSPSVLATALLLLAGCVSDPGPAVQQEAAWENTTAAPEPPPSGSTVAARRDQLELQYVIGPAAARQMSYRIDWQTNTFPAGGSGIRRIDVERDSVFVLDDQNFLSRLRRDDGAVLWRLAIAEPIQNVLGLNYVPELDRVYTTLGGSILVLDGTTGSVIDRQPLEKAAATEPLLFGPYMIYGARNGQLVWHSHQIAFQADAYQISGSIDLPPVLWGGYVAVVGGGGRLRVLNAAAASSRWAKRLLDDVVASPTFGDGILYVAGLDQYLYAIDVETGRIIWRRLTTSPLDTSPVVIEDHVYQYIPGEGLTCFAALPLNEFDGQDIWVCPDATGEVLTRHRDELLVWDARTRTLTIVDAIRGGLVRTVSLGAVERLVVTRLRDGELFVQARDGRVSHLVPRN